MPSRLLVSLAAAVALTWAIACNRGSAPQASADAHPAAPAPLPAATQPAPVAAVGPSATAAPEKADPKPTPAEVAAIEHPHVQK